MLPKALRVGLVPAMGNKLHGPYWQHDLAKRETQDVLYEPMKAEAKQSLLTYIANTQGISIVDGLFTPGSFRTMRPMFWMI